MSYPCIDIDIKRIEENARTLADACNQQGIDIAGVTKVVCGHPKVARAMLRGGVKQIADSRLENLKRMRDDGISAEMLLLRLPMLSNIKDVIHYADISLNSELKIIKALSDEALKVGKLHRVILMIDLGDLREGILPSESLNIAKNILQYKGVELYGVGTNLACLSGIQPDKHNMELLVHIAKELRQHLSIELPIVSGGNSFSLPLLVQNELPEGINHLRLGASILINASPTPAELQLHSNTMTLHAEILELKNKPSSPFGLRGEDAFGKKPEFKDKGVMQRAILGIGKEDIDPKTVYPADKNMEILGASSDHLVIDVTQSKKTWNIGDKVRFDIDYAAVMAAMTSKYVAKNIIYHSHDHPPINNIAVISVPNMIGHDNIISRSAPEELKKSGLLEKITQSGFNVSEEVHLNSSHNPDILSELITRQIKQHSIPLILGGTHSIILPELIGVANAVNEFGLICFDAHGDIVTHLLSNKSDHPCLGFDNHVIIGVRDLTSEEAKKLKKSSITVFTMEDIDRLGMVEVLNQSLKIALTAVDGIHVSLDMDFVDVKDAPGVATPEAGGISFREAHLAMEMIAETGKLISIDIVELAPSNDISNMTIKLGISLIGALLGKRLLKDNQLEYGGNLYND